MSEPVLPDDADTSATGGRHEAILRAERDALLARFTSLGARRASLVTEVLALATDHPHGEELVTRLERVVDGLVEMDLRAPTLVETRDVDGAGVQSPAESPTDVVLLCLSPLSEVRWCMELIESRTPELRSAYLVPTAGGPALEQLSEAAEDHTRWSVLANTELTRAGAPLGVAAALQIGTAPSIAVLTSECRVSHGWSAQLTAALDQDGQCGAAVPLVVGGSAGTGIPLLGPDSLGTDGMALLARFATPEVPTALEHLTGPCVLLRRRAYESVGAPDGHRGFDASLRDYGDRLRADGWNWR